MNCGVYPTSSTSNEVWGTTHSKGRGGGMSHESEHDLAIMVSDFLENGSSCGTDSRYSSDSDTSLSDLAHLADKITYKKLVMDQYESDLFSVVNSLALSINERDLHATNSGLCNAGCIRFSLVKLLRLSGYDAGVCTCKWQGSGQVPGGDHEYIDVIRYNDMGSTERLIIDIDFRSHFEIARAVESYDRILNSLPVIYVGSFTKLKQLLQVMVEAAKSSLKQNSMPLPPWRSLAYLQAKWQSPYHRKLDPAECNGSISVEHKNCAGHLKRLHSSLLSEIEVERMLRPLNRDGRIKLRGEGVRQIGLVRRP
ncbi:hypothetical protein BUALT_Bualt01G0127700 [Buddleja alternifolia]|uniref:Plant-specific domain TIGR01615 family protein n=1 Tax=Buddleja alternifolia TaxID=168488 RepID=A0AAV6Y6N2_9LAMI|nr:hypothetical protein BUALT_Bualt01G0127700 [Buddleja alternifolia]